MNQLPCPVYTLLCPLDVVAITNSSVNLQHALFHTLTGSALHETLPYTAIS